MPQSESKMLQTLKNKQYTTIIHSKEYKKLLESVCSRIVSNSLRAPNEATVESYFDCELFAFFRNIFSPLGFDYTPVKEASIATRRHVSKGRADTAIGGLIIEFKQPSTLSNSQNQAKAISQISDYMVGLDAESEIVGFVTDGTKGCFVSFVENEIVSEGFYELSFEQLNRLIQSIIRLELTGLNSHNLVVDFCNPPENDGIAFDLVKALYNALSSGMTQKTQMLFNEWKELFNLSHDDVSKQQAIIDRRNSLEQLLGCSFSAIDEEYTALFALQTAYVIIVKTVGYRIASLVRYNADLGDFAELMDADSLSLRQYMASLEDGAIFRDYGVNNLLEGDFFSWYGTSEQWTPEIARSISTVFKTLSRYADKPVLSVGSRTADFFKELYQEMVPGAVRHSLGEYYTKKWMAKHVVDEAIQMCGHPDWKGLDPCCGSGTFITVMIDNVLEELSDQNKETQLNAVLSRVKGIDLNPVAVLTARVNYFINIAHLIENQESIEIPIYLGDSSYVPERQMFHGVSCLKYTINTLLSPIEMLVPEILVAQTGKFSNAMTEVERFVHAQDEGGALQCLMSIDGMQELPKEVKDEIHKLVHTLIDLERRNWDGIWARMITNYLTTASLGRFDIVVGNPPWVDWKSLPSGYRDRIKALCISRNLFSGDRVTGGINLNICALITYVAAENWLSSAGVLGFLMPEPLIFQPSYEGFRNLRLSDGSQLYFTKLTNWTESGHPFKPVTQKFLTYYFSKKDINYRDGIDVEWMKLKSGKNHDRYEVLDIDEYFDRRIMVAATCHASKNLFSYVESREQLKAYSAIAGESSYIGREGIEFYPQEMTIFQQSGLPSTKTCTSLKNIQVKKSKYPVPQSVELLETKYLHPLIKGTDITPFHAEISGLIVPFPYDKRDDRLPISLAELSRTAPKLSAFYLKFKDLILQQTGYNERIIGRQGEFYALARVGAYSFAEHHVVFRDNTKWGAAVVSLIDTEWGGKKLPMFQNHAVTISEASDGHFISFDEAHYICGILNAPIVFSYILNSSDSRSFPIRPRIYIPPFNKENDIHRQISELSKEAHSKYDDEAEIQRISKKLDYLYLELAENK